MQLFQSSIFYLTLYVLKNANWIPCILESLHVIYVEPFLFKVEYLLSMEKHLINRWIDTSKSWWKFHIVWEQNNFADFFEVLLNVILISSFFLLVIWTLNFIISFLPAHNQQTFDLVCRKAIAICKLATKKISLIHEELTRK